MTACRHVRIARSGKLLLFGKKAFTLRALTSQLAGAAHGFGLFASALFRRLLVKVPEFHLPEHAFALLLDEIGADGNLERELTAGEFASALERTINRITAMSIENGVTEASSLNFAVTDGRHVIATRCRNQTGETPPSLFYCLGEDCGGCGGNQGSVIISSEPLTRDEGKWALVPSNHMIVVPFEDTRPNFVSSVIIRPLVVDDINPGKVVPIDDEVVEEGREKERPDPRNQR